jgi:hypothetical protein
LVQTRKHLLSFSIGVLFSPRQAYLRDEIRQRQKGIRTPIVSTKAQFFKYNASKTPYIGSSIPFTS